MREYFIPFKSWASPSSLSPLKHNKAYLSFLAICLLHNFSKIFLTCLLSLCKCYEAKKLYRVLSCFSKLKAQYLVNMPFFPQVKHPCLLYSQIPTPGLNLLYSYCMFFTQTSTGRGTLGLLMEKDSPSLCSQAWRTERSLIQKHEALEIKSQGKTKSNFRALEGFLSS